MTTVYTAPITVDEIWEHDPMFNVGDQVKATGNRGVEDVLRSDVTYTVLDCYPGIGRHNEARVYDPNRVPMRTITAHATRFTLVEE